MSPPFPENVRIRHSGRQGNSVSPREANLVVDRQPGSGVPRAQPRRVKTTAPRQTSRRCPVPPRAMTCPACDAAPGTRRVEPSRGQPCEPQHPQHHEGHAGELEDGDRSCGADQQQKHRQTGEDHPAQARSKHPWRAGQTVEQPPHARKVPFRIKSAVSLRTGTSPPRNAPVRDPPCAVRNTADTPRQSDRIGRRRAAFRGVANRPRIGHRHTRSTGNISKGLPIPPRLADR